MTECILSVSDEKVTTSWIVGDDDIYIMTECILSVSDKKVTRPSRPKAGLGLVMMMMMMMMIMSMLMMMTTDGKLLQ